MKHMPSAQPAAWGDSPMHSISLLHCLALRALTLYIGVKIRGWILTILTMPRRCGQGRRVVAPTAAEPLPTADPITPAIPAITPAIAPAIPAITPTITGVPTAILASAHATTLHIARRLPTANIPTRIGPSRTTDEGEYFNLDVSGEEDEDGAAPSPLQTTTGTAQTDPYATGGRVKRPKAAQDSLHFFRDDTTNKCRVCKLCE